MADPRLEKNVQPGLLDRLIDEEPDKRSEAPLSRSESIRRYRLAVKRDLEWLMNTVRAPLGIPDAYKEALNSVISYGLPDISSYTLQDSGDEARLLRSIAETIETFEPRLRRVRVTAPERSDSTGKQTLLFHVEAMLVMDPAPERIAFDTVLEVGKGAYTVKES